MNAVDSLVHLRSMGLSLVEVAEECLRWDWVNYR